MSLISQLKEHYNIAAVVAPYTNGLRQPQNTTWGEYLNGWCPFCQNGQPQSGKSRRFWVNTEIGLCNCMHPRCSSPKPMDVINFYARIWGISNEQAIQDLALRMTGVKVIR